jgi:hypothetical protein
MQPDGRNGGGKICYDHADLEPWDGADAAGLTIEAGKLYQLSNGLCVGPISPDEYDDIFVWKAPQDIHEDASAGWTKSGEFDPDDDYDLDGALDIVAEWVGELPHFKEGDRVVSVCDIAPGDEFVVIDIIGGGPTAQITFRDNADDECDRPACRYRLAGAQAAEAPAARAFKAGDWVVSVTDDDLDISRGDVFTLTDADGVSIFFKDRGGSPRGRPAARYRLADPDPDFAPGDLIRSISDEADDIAPGDTFTAAAIENRGGAWLVSFTHPRSGDRTRFAARYARARETGAAE